MWHFSFTYFELALTLHMYHVIFETIRSWAKHNGLVGTVKITAPIYTNVAAYERSLLQCCIRIASKQQSHLKYGRLILWRKWDFCFMLEVRKCNKNCGAKRSAGKYHKFCRFDSAVFCCCCGNHNQLVRYRNVENKAESFIGIVMKTQRPKSKTSPTAAAHWKHSIFLSQFDDSFFDYLFVCTLALGWGNRCDREQRWL